MPGWTDRDHDAMENAVLALFEETASRYPQATMEVAPPDKVYSGRTLILKCSLPGTAKVVARAGADQVDLGIGKATDIELLRRRRDPQTVVVDEVKAILKAVTQGQFEETIWTAMGSALGSKGVIHLQDGTAATISRGWWLIPLIRLGRRQQIRWQPYG